MSQTVSKVYSYLILLLNINFNGMFNFGYTHPIMYMYCNYSGSKFQGSRFKVRER